MDNRKVGGRGLYGKGKGGGVGRVLMGCVPLSPSSLIASPVQDNEGELEYKERMTIERGECDKNRENIKGR